LKYLSSRGRGECGNPEGISKKSVGRVESRLLAFPYSVISMACLGKRDSQSSNHREGQFLEQEALVRDDEYCSSGSLTFAETASGQQMMDLTYPGPSGFDTHPV
jgi:hypothetical protein